MLPKAATAGEMAWPYRSTDKLRAGPTHQPLVAQLVAVGKGGENQGGCWLTASAFTCILRPPLFACPQDSGAVGQQGALSPQPSPFCCAPNRATGAQGTPNTKLPTRCRRCTGCRCCPARPAPSASAAYRVGGKARKVKATQLPTFTRRSIKLGMLRHCLLGRRATSCTGSAQCGRTVQCSVAVPTCTSASSMSSTASSVSAIRVQSTTLPSNTH